MSTKIYCDNCESSYSKVNDLKAEKIAEGYLKLSCSSCGASVSNISYPID